MKINSKKIKELLTKRLEDPTRRLSYDSKKDELRIEDKNTNKGVTISLPPLVAKAELNLEQAIDETVYYVTEAIGAMSGEAVPENWEEHIFPVIRSTSFPAESKEGIPFLADEHTAETRIYYALDLGNTYRLLDEKVCKEKGWRQEAIKSAAMNNLSKLSTKASSDTVAGNTFYFISTKDGYDASKILNKDWLKDMRREISGEMAVAVPHGDVCIIADIQNNTGYDVLAQMAMSFFSNGHIPITALSFLYEDGELEPIFILGKNKKRD